MINDTELIMSLLGVAVATAATPGPNNFMVLSMTALFGRRKALATYLGVCLGFPFMVLCVSLVVHLFGKEVLAGLEIIKWAGAAFLAYIAFRLFFAGPTQGAAEKGGTPLGFWKVVALQWVNPKAWGMAISTTVLAGEAWLLPALVYQIVIFPAVGIWYFGGELLRRFVIGTRYEAWLNKVMAVLLLVSVAMILY